MVIVAVRPERPGDEDEIRAVTDAAFSPSRVESRIVDALRGSDAWLPSLSLVAVERPGRAEEAEEAEEADGAETAGRVVGHCLCSRGTLTQEDGRETPLLALGPISVLPERQRAGVGRALMAATIEIAAREGWPAIVLVGHATYYPRFGFEAARVIGIEPPAAWSDAHWMALRLPAWSPDLRGSFRYPSAFGID